MALDLEKVIEEKRIIELELFEGQLFYEGICLKANDNIWVIANYNMDKNLFDGYTVFKNRNVDFFSVYKSKFLPRKLPVLTKVLHDIKWINHIDSMMSSLRYLSETEKLVAIAVDFDGYYEGFVIQAQDETIKLLLVLESGAIGDLISIDFKEIKFISFDTCYEQELIEKYKMTLNKE